MNKLYEYAEYVNDKINVSKLTRSNYIGVDNILQNKNGIVLSDYLPEEGYAIKFCKGDILFGNIRPYLKKIWLATFDGGCSTDVLCIRPKNPKMSEYLYSLMCQDSFFDYVMHGAKGTKMPRGDKNHIMRYEFINIYEKEKIGNLIYKITLKIENNNRINDNLCY